MLRSPRRRRSPSPPPPRPLSQHARPLPCCALLPPAAGPMPHPTGHYEATSGISSSSSSMAAAGEVERTPEELPPDVRDLLNRTLVRRGREPGARSTAGSHCGHHCTWLPLPAAAAALTAGLAADFFLLADGVVWARRRQSPCCTPAPARAACPAQPCPATGTTALVAGAGRLYAASLLHSLPPPAHTHIAPRHCTALPMRGTSSACSTSITPGRCRGKGRGRSWRGRRAAARGRHTRGGYPGCCQLGCQGPLKAPAMPALGFEFSTRKLLASFPARPHTMARPCPGGGTPLASVPRAPVASHTPARRPLCPPCAPPALPPSGLPCTRPTCCSVPTATAWLPGWAPSTCCCNPG